MRMLSFRFHTLMHWLHCLCRLYRLGLTFGLLCRMLFSDRIRCFIRFPGPSVTPGIAFHHGEQLLPARAVHECLKTWIVHDALGLGGELLPRFVGREAHSFLELAILLRAELVHRDHAGIIAQGMLSADDPVDRVVHHIFRGRARVEGLRTDEIFMTRSHAPHLIDMGTVSLKFFSGHGFRQENHAVCPAVTAERGAALLLFPVKIRKHRGDRGLDLLRGRRCVYRLEGDPLYSFQGLVETVAVLFS